MTVRRPDEFFARLGRHGLIGFGEAFMTRAWDAEDLDGFLTVLAADLPTLIPASLQKARALVVARPPRAQRSTAANSRNNIAHHYDLSNDLFATFLDETLSYSAALFDTPIREHDGHLVAIPPGGEAAGEPLAEAQARKIDRLLDRTGVRDGTRLLEIGTGWGELAIRAAQRGAHVRSVTLSTEQLDLARARVAAAGVADRVHVELRDYRAIEERAAYDAVVSVEMIEAVGHQFWPEYFATLDRLLAPGGKVGLQAILMPHDRMLATRRTHTWINKYIFPGGFLPSVEAIEQVTREHTTLRVTERLSFGSHYAETLRRWDVGVRRRAVAGPRARLRRDLRADVALLPGVLARGLRIGVPRRRADRPRTMIATRLAETLEPFVGGELPVRLRAWDGSEAGPVDAPLVELRSPDAVRRLLRHPGELGAAQAYVTGELEVHHDLDEALTYVFEVGSRARARRPPPRAGRGRPGRPHRGRAGPAAPAARATGHPGTDPRTAALAAARPVVDRPPLRLLQRLLLVAARRRRWPTRAGTSPATARRTPSPTRSATSSTWSAASSA